MPSSLLLLNGPNLNMLGIREPEIYGKETLADIQERCREKAATLGITLESKQSNHEGELVEWIQQAMKNYSGIIINAGAFTHTSIALRDALAMLSIPVIEVHLSNIYKREEFRHKSLISGVVQGGIFGLGSQGYLLAIDAIHNLIKK